MKNCIPLLCTIRPCFFKSTPPPLSLLRSRRRKKIDYPKQTRYSSVFSTFNFRKRRFVFSIHQLRNMILKCEICFWQMPFIFSLKKCCIFLENSPQRKEGVKGLSTKENNNLFLIFFLFLFLKYYLQPLKIEYILFQTKYTNTNINVLVYCVFVTGEKTHSF